ncbi:hypothetical protein AKO1_014943 [Acrasis kona]|uniref:Uncharacterized protein n=1 Tax=Acrasis kona TaxID=1008807 RepID=A0AAW2Z220_9EUKA
MKKLSLRLKLKEHKDSNKSNTNTNEKSKRFTIFGKMSPLSLPEEEQIDISPRSRGSVQDAKRESIKDSKRESLKDAKRDSLKNVKQDDGCENKSASMKEIKRGSSKDIRRKSVSMHECLENPEIIVDDDDDVSMKSITPVQSPSKSNTNPVSPIDVAKLLITGKYANSNAPRRLVFTGEADVLSQTICQLNTQIVNQTKEIGDLQAKIVKDQELTAYLVEKVASLEREVAEKDHDNKKLVKKQRAKTKMLKESTKLSTLLQQKEVQELKQENEMLEQENKNLQNLIDQLREQTKSNELKCAADVEEAKKVTTMLRRDSELLIKQYVELQTHVEQTKIERKLTPKLLKLERQSSIVEPYSPSPVKQEQVELTLLNVKQPKEEVEVVSQPISRSNSYEGNHDTLIKEGNIPYIISLLKSDDARVTKLSLVNKKINKSDLVALTDSLEFNTTLQELDVSNNVDINNACINVLCDLILTNKSIKKLYMEGIAVTAFDDILDSVERNYTLLDVILPEETTTDEEYDILYSYLDRNMNLR